MAQSDVLLTELKSHGYRLTRTRRALLDVFCSLTCPVQAPELVAMLAALGVLVNKTTVYRELAFLERAGMVHRVLLADGLTRYELARQEHHHHLFCVRCKAVSRVCLDDSICAVSDAIRRQSGFRTIAHSIEFFGICPRCDEGERQE
ncbi:MAG: Fur family transcriptional regulator [Syntrophomonadaceae bacterium]|nr:Fur family transcriptional regulator [Syntrophomonadaceae bacterium]